MAVIVSIEFLWEPTRVIPCDYKGNLINFHPFHQIESGKHVIKTAIQSVISFLWNIDYCFVQIERWNPFIWWSDGLFEFCWRLFLPQMERWYRFKCKLWNLLFLIAFVKSFVFRFKIHGLIGVLKSFLYNLESGRSESVAELSILVLYTFWFMEIRSFLTLNKEFLPERKFHNAKSSAFLLHLKDWIMGE